VSTSFRELLDILSACSKTQGTDEFLLAVPGLEEKPNFTKIITFRISATYEMRTTKYGEILYFNDNQIIGERVFFI
jgi:hypothetical protein